MTGPSEISTLIRAWAEEAADAADRGEVCEENLLSLIGPSYDASRTWAYATEAFRVLLETCTMFEGVLKLIVGLRPEHGLDVAARVPNLASELDLTQPRAWWCTD